jgi:hypothetical protein
MTHTNCSTSFKRIAVMTLFISEARARIAAKAAGLLSANGVVVLLQRQIRNPNGSVDQGWAVLGRVNGKTVRL